MSEGQDQNPNSGWENYNGPDRPLSEPVSSAQSQGDQQQERPWGGRHNNLTARIASDEQTQSVPLAEVPIGPVRRMPGDRGVGDDVLKAVEGFDPDTFE